MGILPRPKNWNNVFVNLFVALGSLTFGYASNVSSTVIGEPAWYSYMGVEMGSDWSTTVTGLINSLFSIGGIIACLYTPFSAEYLGRKRSIMAASVLGVVAAALMTGSVDIAMFIVSRLLMGMCVGMLLSLVPLYQSETSPAEIRGFMIALHGVLIGVSYALVGFIAYGCSFASEPQATWRVPLCFQALWPLILLAGMPYLPESPRWLLDQGRVDEAWDTLLWLHRSRDDPGDAYVHAEFRQMKAQIGVERDEAGTSPWDRVKSAWTRSSIRKRLGLGFAIQFGAQLLGGVTVATYQTVFYNGLGITGHLPLLLVGCFNLICIPGNLINGLVIDHVGRRTFLLTGCVLAIVTLSVEAALTSQFAEIHPNNKVGQGFGVAFIFLFPAFFSTFVDPTMYTIPAEIFPLAYRSLGMAFSTSGQWIAITILLGSAPTGFARVGWRFFLVLIIPSVFYTALMYFVLPETKQKTLEDINLIFGDDVAVTFDKVKQEEDMQKEREDSSDRAIGEKH